MLHFEGDKDFTQLPPDVWAKLSDARFLVQCIPGVESVARAEREGAEFKLRPGFSFVRGTLNITLRMTIDKENELLHVQVHGKGIGSSSTVIASLALTPTVAGTHVHWTADITELGGLLKAIPQGLIQAAAQSVIVDAWTAVEKKMAS